jgi:hypothetical protein
MGLGPPKSVRGTEGEGCTSAASEWRQVLSRQVLFAARHVQSV